jgi:NitT/TauT family transport system substrate-binding protein
VARARGIGVTARGREHENLLVHLGQAALGVLMVAMLAVTQVAAAGPGAGLTKVTFIPQWQPQAQFAGYYVAFEKGFYRQHGLTVKILRGGPEAPASEWLAKGRANFGTMFLSDGIERRARGIKLVDIAQIVQRSALMLVAKKSSGINSPQDMNGKKVGLWRHEFQLQPRAFFRKFGLKVKVIPQAGTINLFLRGGVDVASAMWYNEYDQIIESGVNPSELTTFFMADYGMNFPEDGIYCLADMARRHPQTCRAFVTASIAGWKYAFAHPKEALDIVMRYVNAAHVASNRMHQKWMLARMQDIIQPKGKAIPMGTLTQATYDRVSQEMLKSGMIKAIPKFSKFYKDFAIFDAQ